MEAPWAKSTDEVLRFFNVDPTIGLTDAQVTFQNRKYIN